MSQIQLNLQPLVLVCHTRVRVVDESKLPSIWADYPQHFREFPRVLGAMPPLLPGHSAPSTGKIPHQDKFLYHKKRGQIIHVFTHCQRMLTSNLKLSLQIVFLSLENRNFLHNNKISHKKRNFSFAGEIYTHQPNILA